MAFVGFPGGSLGAGLGGFFWRDGGCSDMAGADWMYLQHGIGSAEKGLDV